MNATDGEQLVVRLPRDLYEAVRSAATEDDRSMASLVRIAIRSHLAASSVRPLHEESENE